MDSEEFKKEIIPMQSAMQLMAERMVGSAEEAEDIVQDVVIYLWEHRSGLEKISNKQGYCIQAVRTRCIDHIRKQKRQDRHTETLIALSATTVESEVEEVEHRSALLHKLLARLPDKQQRIVHMKYLEDYDTEHIASELHMSANNVYVTLSRAIQTLKNELKNTIA